MLPSSPDSRRSSRQPQPPPHLPHRIVATITGSPSRHADFRYFVALESACLDRHPPCSSPGPDFHSALPAPSPEVSHWCCCLPRTSSSADSIPSVRHPPYYHTGTFPGSIFLTRACSQSGCCARHLHCTTVCTTQSEPTLRRADLHSVAGTLTATHGIVAIRQKSPRKHPAR